MRLRCLCDKEDELYEGRKRRREGDEVGGLHRETKVDQSTKETLQKWRGSCLDPIHSEEKKDLVDINEIRQRMDRERVH